VVASIVCSVVIIVWEIVKDLHSDKMINSFFKAIGLVLVGLSVISCSSVATSTHRQAIEGVPVILFNGELLNDLGTAVAGAKVQFWQTDPDGEYNHPRASSTSLDPTFQYYGTATTNEDGTFWFRTHRPGIYTGRPTHFHYRVWVDGRSILTSQFYFADENTPYTDMQVLELEEYDFGAGMNGFATNKTIVVNLNLGGTGPFTPSDALGPFYPVVDFFDADNDLTNNTSPSNGTPSSSPTLSPSKSPVAQLSDIPVQSDGDSIPSTSPVASSAANLNDLSTGSSTPSPITSSRILLLLLLSFPFAYVIYEI